MSLTPIPGLTSRGVVGKWLASQAAAGVVLTVDANGDVLPATSGQVQTAADLPSALSPYLLAALAANTYVPQSRTITINGTTQDLTANRSWTITTTPAAGSIANSQLANVATSTIKGRISASTGVVEDLTPAQARSMLGLATTDAPTFASVAFGGDATITRDAANTVAVRNAANAQRINLYGSFTDAANFRRLFLSSTTGGLFTIGFEGLGTGVSGNSLRFLFDTAQTITAFSIVGTNGTTFWTVGSMLQSGNQQVQLDGQNPNGAGSGRVNLGGGYLHVEGGPSLSGLRSFGAMTLSPSALGGSGGLVVTGGVITFNSLPTTNPGVAGRLWNDGGTLKVS